MLKSLTTGFRGSARGSIFPASSFRTSASVVAMFSVLRVSSDLPAWPARFHPG